MGKEVEFKIKITEDELKTFLNDEHGGIKWFQLTNACTCMHKIDKYYKSNLISQDEIDSNHNRFVRIRKEYTHYVIKSEVIDYLKTKYSESPGILRTAITMKDKHIDPWTMCEINEEDELYCDSEKQSKFFEKMCTNFMTQYFTKEKASVKFTHGPINVEFVSVPGVDGIFLEIEDTSDDNSNPTEQISTLESIVAEIGFNPGNKVQESWAELIEQNK